MNRIGLTCLLALIALGLFFTSPVSAGDKDLATRVDQLQKKVDQLEAEQSTLLEEEIETYLAERPWRAAEGGGLEGVTISARFTAVTQSTVGLEPADRSVVNGDVDLDFDFQVTENLDLFIHLTANTDDSDSNGDGFPSKFGSDSHGVPPSSFGALATGSGISGSGFFSSTTLGGLTDGIGVNGTTPTDPGSITVYEAGIHHAWQIGDNTLHWEMGALDPRTRFLQNAFADDENTQFVNNLFDDSPSILWLTDATGRTVFGVHLWLSFGGDKQFTISGGWFNTPGQWFNQGQGYVQIAWKGELNGREMNLRAVGVVNEFFVDSAGDGDTSFGGSWDWWLSDRIGVWARVSANSDDVNPVELDASGGAALHGLIDSRPDDVLGLAVGIINTNEVVTGVLPEDSELSVEVYYKYVMEDGKLQITPHLIYVSDPGGGLGRTFADDALFILGLRVFVPF